MDKGNGIKGQTSIYKTYIYNKRLNYTNPTKNRGLTRVLRKGSQFMSSFVTSNIGIGKKHQVNYYLVNNLKIKIRYTII